MNNYSERLRILREQRELTQKEVADVIKTTQSYYAQYERGERQIPFDRIIELAKFYNVSIDYIAGLKDKQTMINSITINQKTKNGKNTVNIGNN